MCVCVCVVHAYLVLCHALQISLSFYSESGYRRRSSLCRSFPFTLVLTLPTHTHTPTQTHLTHLTALTLQAMKKVAETPDKTLSTEERNLLSVAYKNVVGSKRFACRDSYTYNCIFVVFTLDFLTLQIRILLFAF